MKPNTEKLRERIAVLTAELNAAREKQKRINSAIVSLQGTLSRLHFQLAMTENPST